MGWACGGYLHSARGRDTALMRAWNLGMDEAGWSEAVMDEAERLLPTLLDAGYVGIDDNAGTWWFTKEGIARAEAIERPGEPRK
jgi:hypothetical protein